VKPDDSGLEAADLLAIERRARRLLDEADAWERFPVPIDDILEAANLKVASHSLFNAANILDYLKGKAASAATNVKAAISKVWGLYDAGDNVIHVDETVVPARQTFLKLHETGHHDIPTHKKLFRFFQDCEKTLAPEIADRFEREANNFARFALFKGDTFKRHAADLPFEIRTPLKLAKIFGASVYASAREFARTNARACAVYVLEPIEFIEGDGFRAQIRRVELSPKFRAQFGEVDDRWITPDHPLGPLIPLGRRMSRPTTIVLPDANGDLHECVGEAFDTTYNVLLLIYPRKALGDAILFLP
jgi:Zn-dependent peptidase ImmA (M78 family)